MKLKIYSDFSTEAVKAFERLSAHPDIVFGVATIEAPLEVTYTDTATGRAKKTRGKVAEAFHVGDEIVKSAAAAAGAAHPVAGAAGGLVDEFKGFAGAVIGKVKTRVNDVWTKHKEKKAKKAQEKARKQSQPLPEAASS